MNTTAAVLMCSLAPKGPRPTAYQCVSRRWAGKITPGGPQFDNVVKFAGHQFCCRPPLRICALAICNSDSASMVAALSGKRENDATQREFVASAQCPLSPPKADMCGALVHVCFGPKADIARSTKATTTQP